MSFIIAHRAFAVLIVAVAIPTTPAVMLSGSAIIGDLPKMASLAKACRCSSNSKDFEIVGNKSVQVDLRIQFSEVLNPTGDGVKMLSVRLRCLGRP